MGLKGTKIYSVFTFTCPRCQEGKVFESPNSYSAQLAKMNKTCPHCGEDFVREPGYYFGAAYVSYALTVALWVALLVALISFDAIGIIRFSISEDPILFLLLGIGLLMVLLPLIYRISRVIWLNLFVKFNPDAVDINKLKNKSAA